MEFKETDKIVIAKPVACRPGFSNLKSFSELLSGAANASPQAAFSDTAVAVIRPRTVRFKPAYNSDLIGAEVFGSEAGDPAKKVPESNVTSNVIYKPIAKLVSKTTVSLLANLRGHGIGPIQPSNQAKHQTDLTTDFHQDFLPQSEKKANPPLENREDDNKSPLVPNNVDRPSYDGHHWRKYGQKHVKGSEYPRSYYKCTNPNCPVKKKVEKTPDGQIAEIVYKGEHNHSKPPPLKRTPPDGHAQRPVLIDSNLNELKIPSWTNEKDEIVKVHEDRSENQNNAESSAQSSFYGIAPPTNDPVNSNNSLGLSGECEEVSESLEAEGDDFKSKRRKNENQLLKAGAVGEDLSEPQTVVQNNTDSEIKGDGFRWRKYGQKVVKGKIYPRSYYKCTSPKCNVRKYVERTSEEGPRTFITTYEGRHNHPMPIKGSTTAEASRTSTKNKS